MSFGKILQRVRYKVFRDVAQSFNVVFLTFVKNYGS